jgi:DNA-binding LacI/PurR family transcriptional regulator
MKKYTTLKTIAKEIRCSQYISVVGFSAMLFRDVLSTPLAIVLVDRKIMVKKAVSFLPENLKNDN